MSVHARPSVWPPIDVREKFSVHVSAESSAKIVQNPKRNFKMVTQKKMVVAHIRMSSELSEGVAIHYL